MTRAPVSEDEGIHVLPVDSNGEIVRGHKARIDCPACQPVLKRHGPLDDPIWAHVEPTWPGASEGRLS